jgi:hypothetical protein
MNAPGVVSQHRSGTALSRSRGKCCSTTTGRSGRVSAPDCLTTVEQSNGRAAPSQRGEPFWWRGRSLLRRTSSEHVVDHSAHACFAQRSTSAPSGARDAGASSIARATPRTEPTRARAGKAGVPAFRANRVSWRATVELRRNTNAGLGPRGGRPRVWCDPTEAEVSSLIGGVPETSPRSWEQNSGWFIADFCDLDR